MASGSTPRRCRSESSATLRRAAQQHATFVWLLQAVEDAHQRRFAGAVLAHDAMNLAARDDEIDVIIGDEGAVALDDADRLELWNGGPGHALLRRHGVSDRQG